MKPTIEQLREALEHSWGADTAKGNWVPEVPSLNQCAVTALVVQDYFGGLLLRCPLNDGDSHYFNFVPALGKVDLTSDQFRYTGQYDVGEVENRTRDYVLNSSRAAEAKTKERYEILARRVFDYLEAKDG